MRSAVSSHNGARDGASAANAFLPLWLLKQRICFFCCWRCCAGREGQEPLTDWMGHGRIGRWIHHCKLARATVGRYGSIICRAFKSKQDHTLQTERWSGGHLPFLWAVWAACRWNYHCVCATASPMRRQICFPSLRLYQIILPGNGGTCVCERLVQGRCTNSRAAGIIKLLTYLLTYFQPATCWSLVHAPALQAVRYRATIFDTVNSCWMWLTTRGSSVRANEQTLPPSPFSPIGETWISVLFSLHLGLCWACFCCCTVIVVY